MFIESFFELAEWRAVIHRLAEMNRSIKEPEAETVVLAADLDTIIPPL